MSTVVASDVGWDCIIAAYGTRYINVIHISHVIHPPGGKVAPDLKFTHQDINDDIWDWFNSPFILSQCTGHGRKENVVGSVPCDLSRHNAREGIKRRQGKVP